MKALAAALLLAAVSIAGLLVPCPTFAQRASPTPTQPPSRMANADVLGGTADLVVTLEDAKKAAYLQTAKVTVRTATGEIRGTAIAQKGRAVFRSLQLDTYTVFVEVQGSTAAQANITLEVNGGTGEGAALGEA